jgi:peptide deformylase
MKGGVVSLARLGVSVLRERCKPVTPHSQASALTTARQMVKYLTRNPAGGLSAPQIHAPIRMFAMATPKIYDGSAKVPTLTQRKYEVIADVYANYSVMINPKIVKASETILHDYEACLSIPDHAGCVPR